jgi:molecular chaperone DnaK
LASRLAGHDVDRVLVDVTPYSFGISFLGERGGAIYPHCYKSIVRRNSPLPVTRAERFFTSHSYQEEVDIHVYEGEDEDALRNILVGNFRVEGLTPMRGGNEVLCRMSLDLDGILHVTAIEKGTGLSKHIRIARALETKTDEEIEAARKRLESLFASRANEEDFDGEGQEEDEGLEEGFEVIEGGKRDREAGNSTPAFGSLAEDARQMVERARALLAGVHEEDREEIVDLNQAIESALQAGDEQALREAADGLRELLFFVEGRA